MNATGCCPSLLPSLPQNSVKVCAGHVAPSGDLTRGVDVGPRTALVMGSEAPEILHPGRRFPEERVGYLQPRSVFRPRVADSYDLPLIIDPASPACFPSQSTQVPKPDS